jgi:formate hydrogenlyase subunit 4
VAYLTYAERKVIARCSCARAERVGPFGLLQPIADGVKLLFKETVIPTGANRVVFVMAPMVTFILALVGWAVIPFDAGLVLADINVGILYLFAISSLGVYGIIMAGWASNSKYAFLGALRSAAQMVSYEVSIGFVIITVLLCVGSLNLTEIVLAQQPGCGSVIPLLPMFVIFFISTLAETNRAPFDLPEARRAGGRLQRRILVDDLRAVLPGRIREHDPDERDDRHPVPRRLAAAASTSRRSPGSRGRSGSSLKIAFVLFCSSGCGRPSRATATTS